MKDGFVNQIGTPVEVFNKPVNLFVAGFIGMPVMNFFDGCKLLLEDGKYIAEVRGVKFELDAFQQKALKQKEAKPCDIVVGIGSGVINDLCKYVSFKRDLPYYIVATATSMDGYASVGSALILEGMKVTLNARPPKGIIGDTAVLKDAPLDMIKAGYGDIIGKFSALNDWKLSNLLTGEYICDFIYDLTYDCILKVRSLAKGLLTQDEESVKALMEALVLVGIAMAFAGSSRPASGSEHHYSHYFEIVGILDGTEYFPHGIDVAYSTIETCKLRQAVINATPKKFNFDRAKWESEIKRVYKSSADGVIALQNKLGWYEKDDFDNVVSKWDKVVEILKEVPSPEEIKAILKEVELDDSEFYKLYSQAKIDDASLYAKDLKDRFTVLLLYHKYVAN
jgi:glycerol-1-phosphate dehydrogenase [NAD(P)+]